MVFTHGSNVNFQESAREMFPEDLENLLNTYLARTDSLIVGTINTEKQELHQYGNVQAFTIDQDQFRCVFTPFQSPESMEISQSLENLLITHEAHFDVIDDQQGQVHVQVAYVTFDQIESGETTYFFADGQSIENPLPYVAAFWEKVSHVGRDIDFSLTGCKAHDLSKNSP